jgi:hypothetical protein
VLQAFRQFMVAPGQMLCFSGPELAKKKAALQQLTQKGLLVEETFKGAYTLTRAGFDAIKNPSAVSQSE